MLWAQKHPVRGQRTTTIQVKAEQNSIPECTVWGSAEDHIRFQSCQATADTGSPKPDVNWILWSSAANSTNEQAFLFKKLASSGVIISIAVVSLSQSGELHHYGREDPSPGWLHDRLHHRGAAGGSSGTHRPLPLTSGEPAEDACWGHPQTGLSYSFFLFVFSHHRATRGNDVW